MLVAQIQTVTMLQFKIISSWWQKYKLPQCYNSKLSHVGGTYTSNHNCISGVMVSGLASSAVDHGFKVQSGQPKDYKIGSCCFTAKHPACSIKEKEQSLVGSASG